MPPVGAIRIDDGGGGGGGGDDDDDRCGSQHISRDEFELHWNIHIWPN